MYLSKIRKNITKIIALTVTTAIIATTPIGDNASKAVQAASDPYVKEMVLSYGKTKADAEKWLKDNDYKVLDGDINAGTKPKGGNDTNVVLVGYKTTTNQAEAITDIALMEMTGGFKITDMKTILNQQANAVDESIKDVKALAKEYKTRYKAAVKAKAKGGVAEAIALRVHDVLNNYIEDDSKKGMGDFFLYDFTNESKSAELDKVVLQCNSQTLAIMENILALAGGNTKENWLEKITRLNQDKTYFSRMKSQLKTSKRAKDYIDSQYDEEEQKVLQENVTKFQDTINDSLETLNEIRSFVGKEEEEQVTQEDIEKYYSVDESDVKTVSDSDETSEQIDAFNNNLEVTGRAMEQNALVESISLIGSLSEYKYGDKTLLEFLLQKFDFDSGTDKYEICAIYEAMTDTQIDSLGSNVDLFTALKYALKDDNEVWGKANNSSIKQLDKMIKSTEDVSIYEGVNREVFEGEVAITSSSDRRDASVLFSTPSNHATEIACIVAGGILSAVGTWVAITARSLAKGVLSSIDKGVYYGPILTRVINRGFMAIILKCNMGAQYTSIREITDQLLMNMNKTGMEVSQDLANLRNSFYKAKALATNITFVLGIAVAVIGIILSAWNIWKIVSERKAEYKGDYSVDIPKYMADVSFEDDGSEDYIIYEVLKCNRNDEGMTGVKESNEGLKDYADINGDSGKYWVAPYVTTDSYAGNPILADSLEVCYGDTPYDEDYRQVHIFDEYNTGANLTSPTYCFNDEKDGTYIRFKEATDEQLKENAKANSENSNLAGTVTNKGQLAITLLIGIVTGGLIGGAVTFFRRRKKA
ncbi:MAG: hypothetical protein K6D02_07345 [Lachnospiraceae bacterium]|nr:hypothetical protein [Lachnospiraceae bacterium]